MSLPRQKSVAGSPPLTVSSNPKREDHDMSNPDQDPIKRSATITDAGNHSKPDRAAIAKQRSDAGTPGPTVYNVDTDPLNVKPPAPGIEFDGDGNRASSTPRPTTLSKP